MRSRGPMDRGEAADNSGTQLTCDICPRACRLREGDTGFCRARRAENGNVVYAGYGLLSALALDPIEKKPFARFHPGSLILSAGGFGCNMRCPCCQNHDISQTSPPRPAGGAGDASGAQAIRMAPEALVERAVQLREHGNIGIAFTYNEPAVGYEFVRDTAARAKKAGLLCAMVTNGYFTGKVATGLEGLIDAFNIDLKCFTQAGYRSLGGGLAAVQNSIRRTARYAHVEVTTLVVPGLSDDADDMRAQARFLADVSPEIPLHLSRYFPRWQADAPPTPPETLRRLAGIANEYLQNVYSGNI